MKRKLVAVFLSAALIMGSTALPVSASALASGDTAVEAFRFDNAAYNYRKTTDLEAEVVNNKVVVTWPVVDKNGNVIDANPLQSTSSVGDPKQGYTYTTAGMVLGFANWNIESSNTNPTKDVTGSKPVYLGLSEKKTDYPVVVSTYLNDMGTTDKTGRFDKIMYLSDEVVADGIAPAYRIEYSKDGVNWTVDHDLTGDSFAHGTKVRRPVLNEDGSFQMNEDGTYVTKEDAKNTFFLQDQYVEDLTNSSVLEPDTTYKIRVTAYNQSSSSKMDTSNPIKVFETEVKTGAAAVKYPAFPTVEGGGTYTQGGRTTEDAEGDVYVVTNLTDSVSDPQPGSLRYGLERKDTGKSSAPRTIVFAVGGTINVDPTASKGQRRLNIPANTTVLGQTAPGTGITIAGASIKFNNNTITRYLRFRLGDGYDQDAGSASGNNIVVDHCSFEWGVDETFSMKELVDSSIQYNIIANSLSMVNKNGENNSDVEIASGESEAKHGMGSLVNGYNTSLTHNLYANHGTRNPRFEGSFTYNGITYANKLDYANNVCYNWGHNSAYGGERGEGQVNFVNNYYKPGPNTISKVYTRLFDCDAGPSTSSYYIKGNVMTSSDEVTKDNTKGFYELEYNAKQLSSPVEMNVTYDAETAEEAYNSVLDSVGASYFRDAVDQRIINQVKNGTGYFINSDEEDGGYDDGESRILETDTDGDGIPDVYEDKFGFDKNDKSDAAKICTDETKAYVGYSNAEIYANELLGEWNNGKVNKANSLSATITSITDESGNVVGDGKSASVTLEAGKTYTLNFDSVAPNIGYAYVYLNENVVGKNIDVSKNSASVKFTPDEKGAYRLAVRVYEHPTNFESESVFSDSIPVTVVASDTIGKNIDGFTSVDIGTVRTSGKDSYDEATGTLVSEGAGRLGRLATAESFTEGEGFHYNYTKVSGNVSMVAKVNNLAKLDYYQHSGLMIAADLDADSEFYMGAVTYLKGEDYEGSTDVTGDSVKAKNIRPLYRTAKGGKALSSSKFMGIPVKRADLEPNYGWIMLEKIDKTVTVYGSLDGEGWTKIESYETTLPDECYIGFATDAAQDDMGLVRYNKTEFSNISIEQLEDEVVYGDADNDKFITSADAAMTLEKSLNAAYTLPVEEVADYHKVLDVDGNGEVNSNDAALILQKSLNGSFKFDVEK